MEEDLVVEQYPAEVDLFDCLPEQVTHGTAMDYFRKFDFEEEVCYLLQCATRKDAPQKAVLEACRELVEERNTLLINGLEGRDPQQIEIPSEEVLEAFLPTANVERFLAASTPEHEDCGLES